MTDWHCGLVILIDSLNRKTELLRRSGAAGWKIHDFDVSEECKYRKVVHQTDGRHFDRTSDGRGGGATNRADRKVTFFRGIVRKTRENQRKIVGESQKSAEKGLTSLWERSNMATLR